MPVFLHICMHKKVSHPFHFVSTSSTHLRLTLPTLFYILRSYQDKKSHFQFKSKKNSLASITEKQTAEDWIKRATDTRALTSTVELADLKKKRANNQIASTTSGKQLKRVSEEAGHHAAGLRMIHNPPTTAGYTYLDQMMVSVLSMLLNFTLTSAH